MVHIYLMDVQAILGVAPLGMTDKERWKPQSLTGDQTKMRP